MPEEMEAKVCAFIVEIFDKAGPKHGLSGTPICVEPVQPEVARRIYPLLKGVSVEQPLTGPLGPYIVIATEIMV